MRHVLKPSKLLALTLLLLCLHDIVLHVLFDLVFHDLAVSFACHDLRDALGSVLPHALDIVAEVLEPKMAELMKRWLRLLRKGYDKVTEGEASAVTYGPRLILEAVEKGGKHVGYVRFERLRVNDLGHFGAQLRYAVASGFSHCVVVCLRLSDVEFTDFLCHRANKLSTSFTKGVLPSLLRIYFHSLGNVVSVEAHPRH